MAEMAASRRANAASGNADEDAYREGTGLRSRDGGRDNGRKEATGGKQTDTEGSADDKGRGCMRVAGTDKP